MKNKGKIMEFKFPEILKTKRLIVRKPEIEDAKEVYSKYAQSKEVTKYLTWCPHFSVENTKGFIQSCIQQWVNNKNYPYSICLQDTGELIGMVDFRVDDFKVDFGYVLAKDYWKHGYMAEAIQPLINELLNCSSIYRVWSVCDMDNYGSKRVMEKVGMKFEGILGSWMILPNISKEPRDCLVYSITKALFQKELV